MAESGRDRKLYLGPRLRLLRRELGINQSQMAEELGVSPSYLNHLERNQRPLSAQMLLRFADVYDIDIREFVAGSSTDASGRLREIFSDPLLRDIGVPRDESMELAENYPSVVEAMTRLYQAVTDLRRIPDAIDRLSGSGAVGSALDWVRDYVQQNHNHFPELESAAEDVAAQLPDDPADLYVALRQRLERDHGVSLRIANDRMMGSALRFYDLHRRRLLVSDRLPTSARLFAAAFQLCMLSLDRPIADQIARAGAEGEAQAVLRVMLTNYTAAALVMPYGRFFAAAEESRYDIALLETRFGASYEQVAHRLTTLARTGARGAPFFMLKVDIAGTVSKRFSGEGVPLARFGGACPRWNLYRAFQAPGQSLSEIVEMPDGEKYFTICRTLPDPAHNRNARSTRAIALGCHVKHAPRILAADGLLLDRANSIGPACHICERTACPDRALPPVTRTLAVSPYQRTASPYPFQQV
ncbi:helix-turn-helix domain-containing protein [Sphingomonas sp. ID0503]|uniref:helix-turn-helix domain-containing protein n=1 Tax=Sphingomonas sp. ID0503 TaxID=3399691 RepID=UPI003AFABCF8